MTTGRPAGFFRHDGSLYRGNDPARGPWDADACHGGPVAGLLVRALERAVPGKQLTRVTINFQRPVPMAGFRVEAEVEREGRASAAAGAKLVDADGKVCASASSLHLATAPVGELPTATLPAPVLDDARPGGFPVQRARHGLEFFNSGIEMKYPPGQTADPGPTTAWMRAIPIVEGETPSPFQSLCPLADCGNGISRNMSFTEAHFVNPDLVIAVFRLPESAWLATEAMSFWEPTGIGLAHATLFDTRGPIGYALQTLLVRPESK